MIVQKFSQKTNTGDEEGLVVVFVFFKGILVCSQSDYHLHKKMQKK
jgi:hypothetical protein